MRKHFLILMLTLLSVAAFATDYNGANTVFRFTATVDGDNKTAVINGFVNGGDKAAVVIPATVDFAIVDGADPLTFKVTAIKADAFKDNATIESVTFNANLATINASAFTGCENLATVNFQAAVDLVTIGENAFKGTKITSLELEKTKVATVNNLLGTGFGDPAVANATLATVKLPKTVTSIAASAFANCTALNSLSFETADAAVTIGASAFRGTALATLDLSKTKIATIGNMFGTTAEITNATLGTVIFPATVNAIEGTAFLNCTNLATLTFNGSTAAFTIAAGALAGTKIATLDLENTQLKVVNNLFGTDFTTPVANNTLTTVKLPKTWTTITTKAFENCTALATISLKPSAAITADAQDVQTLAFNGTALTALNFTGTKVTGVPEKLLMDGANVEENATLQTLTLTNAFVASVNGLNASFANCTKLTTVSGLENTAIVQLKDGEFKGDVLLATIDTRKITNFGKSAFEDCAKLTSIKLDACVATGLGEAAFKNAGLTTVTIPKAVTTIPESCFYGCEELATVTFGHSTTDDFTKISEYAFAYTKIATITIPVTLPNTADGIETKAFGGCESLKQFIFKPTADPIDKAIVNENAFLGCSDVIFYTTSEYKLANADAPKNSTYSIEEPETVTTPFATVKFKKQDKYYVKWTHATAGIKIKKTDAKVYDAWLDDVDKTLNMIQYKTSGGYQYIEKGRVAIIITDKEDLGYETSEDADKTTSWVAKAEQVLKITADAVARLDLEEAAPAGHSIYAWANSDSKGTGFLKITSGKTFPANTLYVYAKEEETAAPGLTVVWRDENGNIENTEVTGIDEIFSNVQENAEMFNLQGIRVNGAAQKGVYIKNGKKFVIK